jgi:hypothetical protein
LGAVSRIDATSLLDELDWIADLFFMTKELLIEALFFFLTAFLVVVAILIAISKNHLFKQNHL